MTARQFLLALVAAIVCGFALAQVSNAPPESEVSEASTEDESLAAEDAEVEQVLSDAELIYKDDDATDFTPSQSVSADQSIDYPIDI